MHAPLEMDGGKDDGVPSATLVSLSARLQKLVWVTELLSGASRVCMYVQQRMQSGRLSESGEYYPALNTKGQECRFIM